MHTLSQGYSLGVPIYPGMTGGVPISPFARHWFVNTNNGVDGNDGRTPSTPTATLNAIFQKSEFLDGRTPHEVWFVGNIQEHLTTPVGVQNVTIRGGGNRPRHADTHPGNGEWSSSTWKSAGTNSPLLTVRNAGWRFVNFLVAAHASNYAFVLERNAIETAAGEYDSSHAEFHGVRFASGAGGISDTGGVFNVGIYGCWFQALTTACILGVGNIGVGQLMWHIIGNHFNNFTNGVKIAGHECVIAGNWFTDGGTPNTTFVLNTNNGAGRDNFVVGNFFQGATANFNTPDVVGCATDVWLNHALDTAAAGTSGVYEIGQPA